MTTNQIAATCSNSDEPKSAEGIESAEEVKQRALGAAIAVCRANQLHCVAELKKHHRPLIGPATSEVAGIRLGLSDWVAEECILLRELMR